MSELESLGIKAVNQTDLENTVTKKANEVIISKDLELDKKRLEKTNDDIAKIRKKLSLLEEKLTNPRTKISERKKIKEDIEWFNENELKPLKQDYDDIVERLKESEEQLKKPVETEYGDRDIDETERDYLIRIGKITAFGNETAFGGDSQKSHVNLRQPGFHQKPEKVEKSEKIEDAEIIPDESEEEPVEPVEIKDDYELEEDEIEEQEEEKEERNLDDGDEDIYQRRLKSWTEKRSALRIIDADPEELEQFKPHPTIEDSQLDDSFKVPGDIYPSLFDYQKTCVQWLWELYNQKTGGILGDEMGLGKTIQVITFIAGLHYSKLLTKPVLVVVPATVLNQWANEFHKWWPPLRCIILHSIGTGMGKKVSEEKLEEYLMNDKKGDSNFTINNKINAKEIIDKVMSQGHVLITTYVGLRVYSEFILPKQWGYCILDEGHKIRNPNSDISLLTKQVRTVNRLILSGTPIQNNLIELWSLFDFVFPGRLGTLPIFENQFALPIKMGGYANASNVQVQTSYKCATILRDLISPYLLRRLKNDVARDLPKKEEMVLFVKLTQFQQDLYESFLKSEDLNAILKGKRNMLMGVDVLRKICNHPDLLQLNKNSPDYGNVSRSGKLEVVKKLVQLWVENNHKILIFCQTRQMLDILERFITRLQNEEEIFTYNYLRMDGTTPISRRQDLVDNFNNNPAISIFLLTTKVGGLGVNLTGADRIIIYDPDWNPSTDMQARERAWRLGQKKDIVIYRLMIAGSIEEKIYHRQIFKTFLTNKILKDPKQRKFFKMNDLYDLFTLGDQEEQGTETGAMFGGNETNFQGSKKRKNHENNDDFMKVAKIMGVSKLDKFEDEEKDGDNELMEGIFNNVHSSIQHDDIFKEPAIDNEVNKIVNDSLHALNESRKLTRRNKIGVPTWTGKFGAAGKTKSKLASKNVIAKLKQQDKKVIKPQKSDTKLIESIISVFKDKEKLKSTDILIKLKNQINIKNTQEILLVKLLLRKVCDWDAINKLWTLKSEYKEL